MPAPHHLNAWNGWQRKRMSGKVFNQRFVNSCLANSSKCLYIHSYTDAPYNSIKADSKSCGYVCWIHRICVDGSRHPQIKCCVFQNIRIPACGRGPSWTFYGANFVCALFSFSFLFHCRWFSPVWWLATKKSFHVFLIFFLCLFVYLFFTSRSGPLSVIHASVDIKILV